MCSCTVTTASMHITYLFICYFQGVYSNNKLYQIDMKFSRSKSNAAKKDEDAPVRDRSSLWPGGIIPYTVTYNIRKLFSTV